MLRPSIVGILPVFGHAAVCEVFFMPLGDGSIKQWLENRWNIPRLNFRRVPNVANK